MLLLLALVHFIVLSRAVSDQVLGELLHTPIPIVGQEPKILVAHSLKVCQTTHYTGTTFNRRYAASGTDPEPLERKPLFDKILIANRFMIS